MAADCTRLQGEICENPTLESKDLSFLLEGFLKALVAEQKLPVGIHRLIQATPEPIEATG